MVDISELLPPLFFVYYNIHIYFTEYIIAYDRKRGGTIVIDKRPGGRTVTSLIISQADITDSGNYTCDPASNYSKWVIVHVTTGKNNPEIIETVFACIKEMILYFDMKIGLQFCVFRK